MRWRRRAIRSRAVLAATVAALACTRAATTRPARTSTTSSGVVTARAPSPRDASLRTVRIALARSATTVRVSSDGGWELLANTTGPVLARALPGESWTFEIVEGRLVAASESASQRHAGQVLIARPAEPASALIFNGRRWRGEIVVRADERGTMLVVNRLGMDEYLRGVVPLEIGTRAMSDFAAAEAQAVAARSYAYMHLAGPERPYDMLATVSDQVYGGVGAETLLGNQAVENTAGLVLMYDGRIVNAPYHGNCGGFTAEPGDSWRSGPEPYLRRVSDQIPGTDRFYCEAGPRFRWTRRYSGEELRQSIVRYLRTVPAAPQSVAGVRSVAVTEVTPAGRVAALTVDTDRGAWTMRGNDIRAALRTTSGEMMYSTYFSVDAVEEDGLVRSLELRGGGNGHGIGMCQSGAMGRARAGQDFRTILTTYYPGTTIGTID
jgi:stage II sporulation protein D